MITLRHAIKIAAARAATFRALTDPAAIGVWQQGTVMGRVAPGETFNVSPRPNLTFVWRTDAVEPDTRLVRTCLEGPGNSGGRRVTITLADNGDGRTRLDLADEGWEAGHPHLALCNTEWGAALGRLRAHLEGASA